ncbi:MAG: hypothetical protein ACW99G_00530 [Candidatus Thorarchaeota archaeon]
MPSLTRPSVTKVVTKEGEIMVNISIDLNLNLNTGDLQITSGVTPIQAQKDKKNQDEEVEWQIPDFKMGDNIKFGEDLD